jgi:putative chitinase
MATIGEDVKQNLREKIEESTGIIGQTLRAKREAAERDKKITKQVEKIQLKTKRIDTRAKIISRMDVSFLQISKNLQSIAKVLKAQVTLQDQTNAVIGKTKQHEETKRKVVAQAPVGQVTDTKEESSIFDKIGDLLDIFDKKRKGKGGKRPAKETPKEKAKRAEVEKKQRGKVEDKATAAKKAAEEEAKAAGKGAKEIAKAGQKAAKEAVKAASAATVKAAARKALLKSIGKMAAKSLPIVGGAVGVGFAIERLLAGDPVGAGIEAAGGLGSALTSIPATILNTTRDVYFETYGVYPEADDSPDKDERYAEVYRIVKEEVEAVLKQAVYAQPKAPEGMEFDAEGNVISAPPPPPPKPKPAGPAAAAPKTAAPAPSAPAPSAAPTSVAQPPPSKTKVPEAQIRATAQTHAAAITKDAQQPTGIVGTVMSSLKEAGIVSDKAIANILATIKAETGFKIRSENLNYTSAEQIQKTFGKRRIPSLEFAAQFVKNPEALANEVYKSTDGNREPGDGFKFRGRGFIQHTGRNQYEGIKKFTGIDVVSNPDLLNDPVVATKALAWFFLSYKGKKPEQLENMATVNKAVGFADTTGEKAEKRMESAAQINASISSGQNLDSLSTSVASSKKSLPTGQTTIVAVTNVQQTGKAPPRAPQPSVMTSVG